jgi:glucose-6-phosphate isomerase
LPTTRNAASVALDAVGLYFDYAKQRVDERAVALLLALAQARDLRGRIDAMFRGDRINTTEDRSVLHVALRMPKGKRLVVDGRDVLAGVHEVLDRMAVFCERVRSGVEGPQASASATS